MSRMILLALAFLFSAGARGATWSSVECQRQMRSLAVDGPSVTGENIRTKCEASQRLGSESTKKYDLHTGGIPATQEVIGTCNAIYTMIELRRQFYARASEICARVQNAQDSATGSNAFEASSAVLTEARTSVTNLLNAMKSDISVSANLRDTAIALAKEETRRFEGTVSTLPESQRPARQEIVRNTNSKVREIESRASSGISSREERKNISRAALALPAEVKGVGESVAATSEIIHFSSQVKEKVHEMETLSNNLNNQTSVVNNNNRLDTAGGASPSPASSPGSSISGMVGSALPFAPLALGAAGLLMQKQSADAAAAAAKANSMPQEFPSGSAAIKPMENPSSTKLTAPGSNASSEGDITASSKLGDGKAAELGDFKAPPYSYAGYAESPGAMKAFSGSLGNSPIFGGQGGSNVSANGTSSSSGGSAGGGRSKGKLDDLFEGDRKSASSPSPAGGGAVATGGGGGGGAASSSFPADPSLKDMFKMDPLPPMGPGPGMPGGAGDPILLSAEMRGMGGFSSFEGSGGESGDRSQASAPIPGENDTRSLFARVKDLHLRCQKKGCVTSGMSGKI